MKQDITPALVHSALTPEQLAVWQLHNAGFGYRRIARILDISVTTARDRLERARVAVHEATKENP